MNKGELIDQVAKSILKSKKDAQEAVDAVFSVMTQALQDEDSVMIAGFGTFKVRKRSARMGVNPGTGEKMEIKAKNVVRFVPGKALKDGVN